MHIQDNLCKSKSSSSETEKNPNIQKLERADICIWSLATKLKRKKVVQVISVGRWIDVGFFVVVAHNACSCSL